MPQPTVLCYDPVGAAWLAKLPAICAVQGLRLRRLEAGHLDLPLADLAQGAPAGDAPGEIPEEPILILCRLVPGQLDRLLAALRKAGVPRTCLKAILTPTNAGWTLRTLYGELRQERERLG